MITSIPFSPVKHSECVSPAPKQPKGGAYKDPSSHRTMRTVLVHGSSYQNNSIERPSINPNGCHWSRINI